MLQPLSLSFVCWHQYKQYNSEYLWHCTVIYFWLVCVHVCLRKLVKENK